MSLPILLRVCNVDAKVSSQFFARINRSMHPHPNLLFRFLSYSGLPFAVFTLTACNVAVPAQGKGRDATVSVLSISCEAHDAALQCRALGRNSDPQTDPSNEADLTEAVGWSTSNANTATVVRGRIAAHAPGMATIVASMRSGDETVSSSVLVAVDSERTPPQVAYDLKGLVRDVLNDGVKSVELTLVDQREQTRTTITSGAEGAFQFVPLLSGQYRLRASKPGYRTVERPVNVPDAAPLTLVLLFEPK